VTEAGSGQVIRPLVHPGTAILLVAILSYAIYRRRRISAPGNWRVAAGATWRSAMPATIGIVSMVGLSTLMDHTGMTQRLANALADLLDTAFPTVSALVGMLGAFATGSNNNSNVLLLECSAHPCRANRRRLARQRDLTREGDCGLQHGGPDQPGSAGDAQAGAD